MIELEEISPYGIYYFKGKSIQLLEDHFKGDMISLAAELIAIPIDTTQLWRLKFNCSHSTGICSKKYKDCKVVLRQTKHGWVIQFPGSENAGYIHHIHQVQRLWFSHFLEHLWLPKITKQQPPKPIFLENDVRSEKFIHGNRTYVRHTTIYPEDQPFYLSWDSRLLMRSADFAVWRVSEKNPLFQLGERNWGLTLINGKASEEDRLKAGKWLHSYLISTKL